MPIPGLGARAAAEKKGNRARFLDYDRHQIDKFHSVHAAVARSITGANGLVVMRSSKKTGDSCVLMKTKATIIAWNGPKSRALRRDGPGSRGLVLPKSPY